MERRLVSAVLALGVFLIFCAGPAGAQVEVKYVPEKLPVPAEGKAAGWHALLKAAANIAFSHNRSVVGNVDGATWNVGTLIQGGLGWLSAGGHSWENSLKWQLNYTQTPTLERFVKSIDAFDFSSVYLYCVPSIKWMGPFTELVLKTSVLPSYDIRADHLDVVKLDKDGNETGRETVWAKNRIDLTGAFAPALFKEGGGVFADALDRKEIKLSFRAGLAAWEVLARNGYVVADNAATPELELKAIQDSTSLGGGAIAKAFGALRPEVTYEAKAEVMYPFILSVDTPLAGADLLNVDLGFLLQVKLQKWLSLDYTLKALRLPLVSDRWQIQNGLLLSASLELLR